MDEGKQVGIVLGLLAFGCLVYLVYTIVSHFRATGSVYLSSVCPPPIPIKKKGVETMKKVADIKVDIHIADIEPIRSVLAIVMEMVNDDRVPLEYKARIAKELMGATKAGGDTV